MMERRHIRFGMSAVALAMKAKQGQCRDFDRLTLAMDALDLVRDDDEAIAAVKKFATESREDAVGAGRALHGFIRNWRRSPKDIDADPPFEFDWQGRADING